MNDLEAKVAAVNMACKEANKWQETIIEFFSAYIGQKVTKADNTFTAKIEKVLPTLPYTNTFRVLLYAKSNNIWLQVSASFVTSEGHGQRHECSMVIGDIRDNVLTGLREHYTYQHDYSVEWIAQQRKIVEEARKVYENEKAKLGYFNER